MASEYRSNQTIPVDVSDHGDAFEVSADLPGYGKQDIDVRVMTDRVQITVRDPESTEAGPKRRGDRHRGRRSRVVTLPEAVVHEGASARYENGVLWMRLEKR